MLTRLGMTGDEQGDVVTRVNDPTHDDNVCCEYIPGQSDALCPIRVLGRTNCLACNYARVPSSGSIQDRKN